MRVLAESSLATSDFCKDFDQGAPWTFVVQNKNAALLHHERQGL